MKFSFATVSSLLLADHALAFVAPRAPLRVSQPLSMALDMPPAPEGNSKDLPVIQQNSYGQPTDVRYSDFLKLVNADRVEKVTFSSDGTQLLGVDVDGVDGVDGTGGTAGVDGVTLPPAARMSDRNSRVRDPRGNNYCISKGRAWALNATMNSCKGFKDTWAGL